MKLNFIRNQSLEEKIFFHCSGTLTNSDGDGEGYDQLTNGNDYSFLSMRKSDPNRGKDGAGCGRSDYYSTNIADGWGDGFGEGDGDGWGLDK